MSIEPDRNIIVPGRGVLNLDAEAVNRRIQEHDERLRFGFNQVNGDWVVYIRMPRNFEAYYYIEGEPVYPVLGFGSTIPTPDEAVTRLREADTMQHGLGILERMRRENAKIEANIREANEALNAEVAERVEFNLRKEGEVDKYAKVFFLSKDD